LSFAFPSFFADLAGDLAGDLIVARLSAVVSRLFALEAVVGRLLELEGVGWGFMLRGSSLVL
jgi:hypothetical protein